MNADEEMKAAISARIAELTENRMKLFRETEKQLYALDAVIGEFKAILEPKKEEPAADAPVEK